MGETDQIASDDGHRRHVVDGGRRGPLLLIAAVVVVVAGVLVGALTLPGRATTAGSGSPTTSPVAAPVVAAPSPSFTAADGSEYLVVVPGTEPHVLDGDDLARWTARWVAATLPPEALVDVAGARLAEDSLADEAGDESDDVEETGDEVVEAFDGTVVTSVSIEGQRRPMVLSLGLPDRSRVCAPALLDPATPCTRAGKPAGRSAWTASFGATAVSHAWLVPDDPESPVPLVRAVSAGIGEVPPQAADLARDWVQAAAAVMARRIWDVPMIGDPDYYTDLESQDQPMPTPSPRPELRPRLAAWEDRVRVLLPTVAERLGWTLDADASSVRLGYPGECLMARAENVCESWAFDIDVELVAAAPTRHRWAVRDTWGHMMDTLAGYGECATDGPSGWPEPERVEAVEYSTGRCSRDGNGDVAAYTVGSTSRFESGAGFLAVPAGTDPGISPDGLDEAVAPVMRELTAAYEAITGDSVER